MTQSEYIETQAEALGINNENLNYFSVKLESYGGNQTNFIGCNKDQALRILEILKEDPANA